MNQLPPKFLSASASRPQPAAPAQTVTAAVTHETTRPRTHAAKAPRMLYWEQMDPTSNSLYPLD